MVYHNDGGAPDNTAYFKRMLNSIKNISRLSEKTSSRSASSIIAPASAARTTGSARSSHRLSRFHRSINPDRVFGTKVLGAKSRSGWCAHLGRPMTVGGDRRITCAKSDARLAVDVGESAGSAPVG